MPSALKQMRIDSIAKRPAMYSCLETAQGTLAFLHGWVEPMRRTLEYQRENHLKPSLQNVECDIYQIFRVLEEMVLNKRGDSRVAAFIEA